MNYRHDFHAGNFADVFKHVVLCRILHYLRAKPAAFRVIDTHAGAGLYDLAGDAATRGGEWHDGIERILYAPFAEPVAALLSPYLDVVRAVNERQQLRFYPGSPAVTRAWLRSQDRLIACEIESTVKALSRNLRGDDRIKILEIDGWTALNAYVPPKERRGVVLVDPPFEDESDFWYLAEGLAGAHRKWPTGIYALWYPIKGRREPELLAKRLKRLGIPKILRAELIPTQPGRPAGLQGAGMIIVNPPWPLKEELSVLLPSLAAVLRRTEKAGTRLEWLGEERLTTSS
ncbi:MAG TPA: 23S rRNA (adenine(2030)-N(6))-methyltransferase RlmJ [Pseudolabrys sp.]|nr:23S rRNA (adenine(2030)-N(6))-methyltransferase RlmJ [Pseudolabrys sp.]